MQRYLVLILLSLAWAGLVVLSSTAGELSWGLETSAIGLMLLIAMTAGEAMAQVGLPRLAGYVVTGLCFGPQSIQILDTNISSALLPLEHVALAVLALRAGYLVDLERVRSVLGTTAIMLLTVTAFVGVFGTIITALAAPFVTGLGNHPETQEAFGVMVAVLLLVASPAVVGTVLGESGAKSRMTDVVLALTIGLELIALVVVSMTWSFEPASASATHQGMASTPFSPAWTIVRVLGMGVGLGIGLRLMIGSFHRTALLPLLVLGAALLPAVHATGAGIALTFAITGLVARNVGRSETREIFQRHFDPMIRPAAEMGSLVFFTLLGVHLKLPETWSILVAAVLVSGGRAAGAYLGTLVGARWSRAPEDLRGLWTGLLPQGPAALTVMVIATTTSPALAQPIVGLISAVVLVDLLVGSIAFRMALHRKGLIELSPSGRESVSPEEESEALSIEGLVPIDAEAEDPLTQIEEPDDPTLHRVWRETRARLRSLRERVQRDAIDARLNRVNSLIRSTANHARHGIQAASEACGRAESTDGLRRVLREHRTTLADQLRGSLEDTSPPAAADEIPTVVRLVAEAIDEIVLTAPAEVDGLTSDRHARATPGDGPWIRIGKLFRLVVRSASRFFGRTESSRDIPYRRIVRRTLGGELVANLAPVETLVGRAELKALRRVETLMRSADSIFLGALNFVEDGADARELRVWLQSELALLTESSQLAQEDSKILAHEPLLRFSEVSAESFRHLTRLADDAGTFIVRESQLRYASVAPAARDAAGHALEERKRWSVRQRALLDRIGLWARLVGLQNRLREVAIGQALGPAQRMHERVGELLELARDRCALLVSSFQQELTNDEENPEDDPPSERARALIEELTKRAARPLEGITHAQRSGAVIDRLLSALEQVTGPLPDQVALLPESELLGLIRGRAEVGSPIGVSVRSIARTFFDRRVAVRLAEHMRALETSAEEALGGVRDATRLIDLRLTRGQDAITPPDGDEAVEPWRQDLELWIDTLRTVLDRLGQELSHIEETAKALRREIGETEQGAVDELWKRLQEETRRPGIEEAVSGLRQRLDDLLRWLVEHPVAERLRDATALLTNRLGKDQVRTAGDRAAVRTGPVAIRQELDGLRPDIRGLPYVYGKLFSLDATENEAFIVEREGEIARVRECLSRSDGTSLLIVGDRGSGRTSVIRAALSGSRSQRDTIWLDADRSFSDGGQLLKWIGRAAGYTGSRADRTSVTAYLSQHTPILILDGLDQIVERSQGGIDALKSLSALIGATREHVVWIATVETGIWHLLREVAPITDLFTEILSLQPLSAEGIALAVRRRHRLSGQEVAFVDQAETGLERLWWRITGQDPEAAYWEWLADQCGGNPRNALLGWMLSLVQRGERGYDVMAGQTLTVSAFELIPLRLAPVILLAMEHSLIDLAHLSRAMGWTELDASSAVSTLTATGLLTRRPRADGEQTWVIPAWAEPGVRAYLIEAGLVSEGRALV